MQSSKGQEKGDRNSQQSRDDNLSASADQQNAAIWNFRELLDWVVFTAGGVESGEAGQKMPIFSTSQVTEGCNELIFGSG